MKNKISQKTKKIDTYIGFDSHIKGDIESENSVSIDGKIDGDVTCKGEVIIGKNSVIIGNVKAYNVTASGHVKGNINADDFIKLTTSCTVEGDICARSFIADEGAVFNGVCNMCSQETKKDTNQ